MRTHLVYPRLTDEDLDGLYDVGGKRRWDLENELWLRRVEPIAPRGIAWGTLLGLGFYGLIAFLIGLLW